MNSFPEVSDRMARKVDLGLKSMAKLETLEELELNFISTALQWLPGDCIAWNNWKPDWSEMISGYLNNDYQEAFISLLDTFSKHVAHHPVIIANQFPTSALRVLQLSDFESKLNFRKNPLFVEVYQHLDSHHQIAFAPCLLRDRRILLTLNRKLSDFKERDKQILGYAGMQLEQVALGIDRNQRLRDAWQSLCRIAGTQGIGPGLSCLTPRDMEILTLMMRGKRISDILATTRVRRDTLDKRLGSIRKSLA